MNNFVVLFGPIPFAFDGPHVDDVTDQVKIVHLDRVEELIKHFRLAILGTEVDV